MKRIVVYIICFISTLGLYAQENTAELIRKQLFDSNNSKVLVAAHRGDWRNFPENSLEAIDNAIKMGVDIVELDVQRTEDGVLILMHDSSLDRTTTGKGKIAEIKYDSIAKINLKNGCAIRTIHKVPTLEEALNHAKGKILVNLDKADRYFDQIYELMKKTGTTRQVIMKGSKNPDYVKSKFGDYLKDVIYMPVVNLDKEGAKKSITVFSTSLSPVAYELVFNKNKNLAIELGSMLKGKALIWYNTLWDTLAGGYDDDAALKDCDASYGYLIDNLNCRIIQTDRPALLLEYLRSRNLHN